MVLIIELRGYRSVETAAFSYCIHQLRRLRALACLSLYLFCVHTLARNLIFFLSQVSSSRIGSH
jgi:hypothetical protein